MCFMHVFDDGLCIVDGVALSAHMLFTVVIEELMLLADAVDVVLLHTIVALHISY